MAWKKGIKCKKCGEQYWEDMDWEWDGTTVISKTLRCINCLYERKIKCRKIGIDKSPSQEKAINKILAWVRDKKKIDVIEEVKEETMKYGAISFVINNNANTWNKYLYIHCFIGRKGAIELISYHGFYYSISGAWSFLHDLKAKPSKSLNKELNKLRKEIQKSKKEEK